MDNGAGRCAANAPRTGTDQTISDRYGERRASFERARGSVLRAGRGRSPPIVRTLDRDQPESWVGTRRCESCRARSERLF